MSSLINTIKHLELSDQGFSLPVEDQFIAEIVNPRGNNLHQVVNKDGEEFMVSMPRKFRKIVYFKRGDYILAEPISEGNKVKAEIIRILSPEVIKHYIQEKVWPDTFLDGAADILKQLEKESKDDYEMDLPPLSDEDSDIEGDFRICNPNRKVIQFSESEEESSDSSESSSNEEEPMKRNQIPVSDQITNKKKEKLRNSKSKKKKNHS